MPKNKGKGGKNRRRGRNENDKLKRELIFKEDGQEYGQATKMMGNGWVNVSCFDGKTRLCHIRGKMRKKVWVNPSDIILVSLREFQDDKGDVIYKYAPDEARTLKAYGELPDGAIVGMESVNDDALISFETAEPIAADVAEDSTNNKAENYTNFDDESDDDEDSDDDDEEEEEKE